MSVVLYYRRRGSGELGGSIWSQIAAIGGAIAGPTAAQAGLPNWAATAIGAGGQIASGLLTAPPQPQGGCTMNRVSGSGEMALCLDTMWASFQQLRQSGTPQQIFEAALGIKAALENPQYFVQTSTNPYFVNTKQFFADFVTNNAPAAGTLPGTASPQTAVAADADTIAGIPVKTALIAGGGLLLVWLVLT